MQLQPQGLPPPLGEGLDQFCIIAHAVYLLVLHYKTGIFDPAFHSGRLAGAWEL